MGQVSRAAKKNMPHPKLINRVAILDAGAQYGKVIDRRVRNLNVESDILPLDTPYEKLLGYSAYIISGGPESVYDPKSPKPDPKVLTSGKPLLGICYGLHLINQTFGGSIEKKSTREDGQFAISVKQSSPIFSGLKKTQQVLLTHGDSIGEVAPGFSAVGMSGRIVAAIADEKRKAYGVQFHPEVDLTQNGKLMLSNFLFKVAGLKADFTLKDRLQEAIGYIRQNVGDRQVLAFASGGVDSTVLSVMLGLALPAEKINVVHVNTGFMRHRESETVKEALESVGIKLQIVDASKQFYNARTKIKGKLSWELCWVCHRILCGANHSPAPGWQSGCFALQNLTLQMILMILKEN
jgi:GMP synthase (glutamine-hydrolysing)